MNESTPANNLIAFALDASNGVYKNALTHVIVCQCAIATADFDRVVSSVENMRALKASDEECAKLLGEIDLIISDKEWTISEYKQKSLLSKINRYFEACYENVSLNITVPKFAALYLEFVKSRREMEFGYAYLALARYYMALSDYEQAFGIIEMVINKFPDSKYEYLALSDLLEIYKMEYQSLERNNEEFGPIVDKIVQILLYVLKSYSYQPRSFYTIIKFAYIVFRHERGVTALSFFEKLSETYGEAIYEEEIKLEFVNYYIGRAKYKDALTYLAEYENIFSKTTRRGIINLYKFECYICLRDAINAQNIYKAVDEKNYNDNGDALLKLYYLTARYAGLLEEVGCVRDAISVYERIYRSVPLKKLKEDALYKLITLNINFYFDSREKMPDEIKNIARGYCVSFMSKYPKSPRLEEVKLIYEGLNPSPAAKTETAVLVKPAPNADGAVVNGAGTDRPRRGSAANSSSGEGPGPGSGAQKSAAAVQPGNSAVAEVKTGGVIKMSERSSKAAKPAAVSVETTSVPLRPAGPASVKTPDTRVVEDGGPENRGLTRDAGRPDSPVEAVEKKAEGFDYFKFVLYSSVMAVYCYVFFMLPVTSLVVFYSKMLLSYFPVLLLTGFLLSRLFKKMNIFE